MQLVLEIWLVVLVWVVLIGITIMVVVHILSRSLCMSLCLDLVVLVHALGLRESVDFTTNDAGEKFLSKSVVDNLTFGCVSRKAWLCSRGCSHLLFAVCLQTTSYLRRRRLLRSIRERIWLGSGRHRYTPAGEHHETHLLQLTLLFVRSWVGGLPNPNIMSEFCVFRLVEAVAGY